MTTIERVNELEAEVARLRAQLLAVRNGMTEIRLIHQALRELVELRTVAACAPRAAKRRAKKAVAA